MTEDKMEAEEQSQALAWLDFECERDYFGQKDAINLRKMVRSLLSTKQEAGEVSRSQTALALEEAAEFLHDTFSTNATPWREKHDNIKSLYREAASRVLALSLPAPDGSSAAGAGSFDALEAAAKVADAHADGMRTLRDAAQQSGDGLQAEEHHNAMRISEFIAKGIRCLKGDGR